MNGEAEKKKERMALFVFSVFLRLPDAVTNLGRTRMSMIILDRGLDYVQYLIFYPAFCNLSRLCTRLLPSILPRLRAR